MLDVLIRGGRVIDGAGNPWYRADVGIADGRIAASAASTNRRERMIDASGLFVCPGFTDMHTHSDLQLLVNPPHEPKLLQGVTLDVIGQDGLSYAPVTDEVLEQLAGSSPAGTTTRPASTGAGGPSASTSTGSTGTGSRSTPRTSRRTGRSG